MFFGGKRNIFLSFVDKKFLKLFKSILKIGFIRVIAFIKIELSIILNEGLNSDVYIRKTLLMN